MRHVPWKWASAACVAVGLAGAAPAFAYPIAPVTLWSLVERSDLIVLGYVRDIELETMRGAVAKLDLREVWKGSAGDTIEVPYPSDLGCPAPPKYETGEVVLAFLRRDGKDWGTVALSYGTLYPAEEEQPDYRDLVHRAAKLQAHSPRPSDADRREWLVEAAARRATRWHGLYELLPASDEVHSHYDQRGRDSQVVHLDMEDFRRLAEGFAREPALDQTLPMMLDVLAGYADPAVDRAAARAIQAGMAYEALPWWTADVVSALALRLGARESARQLAKSPPGDPILADPLIGGQRGPADAEVRAAWEKLRKRYKLDPEPLELRVSGPRVRGVGPDTPP